MTKISLLVSLFLLFASLPAFAEVRVARDVKHEIVGHWQAAAYGDTTVEFKPDGKLVIREALAGGKQPLVTDGTYVWQTDDTMVVTLSEGSPPREKAEAVKVAIDGDILTTIDSQGKTEKFSRLK